MNGYIFEAQGKQWTPDGVVAVNSTAQHNAELTRQELAAWAQQPEQYAGYVTFEPPMNAGYYGVRYDRPFTGQAVTLTTWTGETLGTGTVTGVFRNNLTGSRTVSIRVTGTNGAVYSGRFGDEWSQLCRVRKSKRG
jgi:hypothetical protein